MPGPRQPIELIIAKGNKHLTKEEIAERRAQEVKPCTDDIVAPSFLTKKQKDAFYKIAGQLEKINLMGETDVDSLARYISAQDLYEDATKDLRAATRRKLNTEGLADPELLKLAAQRADVLDTLAKLQDRYFKQAQTAAAALGLTISSRCKLVVPVKEEEPKVNKFARFTQEVAGAE